MKICCRDFIFVSEKSSQKQQAGSFSLRLLILTVQGQFFIFLISLLSYTMGYKLCACVCVWGGGHPTHSLHAHQKKPLGRNARYFCNSRSQLYLALCHAQISHASSNPPEYQMFYDILCIELQLQLRSKLQLSESHGVSF